MNSNPPYVIHGLHGFLGKAADWEILGITARENFKPFNLFHDLPIVPLEEWAEAYNQYVRDKALNHENILMGYSLGGRLGLHAVLQNPKQWKAAIIVSAHLGLKTEEERKFRIQGDEKWAKKFETQPWEPLMQEWKAQSVFKQNEDSFQRKESDFERNTLSKALTVWSLGRQENLKTKISELPIPILWVVGEEDKKFKDQADDLSFKHPQSQVCVVTQSGHRVPWEQSKKYLLNITQFIQNLE